MPVSVFSSANEIKLYFYIQYFLEEKKSTFSSSVHTSSRKAFILNGI